LLSAHALLSIRLEHEVKKAAVMTGVSGRRGRSTPRAEGDAERLNHSKATGAVTSTWIGHISSHADNLPATVRRPPRARKCAWPVFPPLRSGRPGVPPRALDVPAHRAPHRRRDDPLAAVAGRAPARAVLRAEPGARAGARRPQHRLGARHVAAGLRP